MKDWPLVRLRLKRRRSPHPVGYDRACWYDLAAAAYSAKFDELYGYDSKRKQRSASVPKKVSKDRLVRPLGRPFQLRHLRPDAEWAGKVIAKIGKAAGIVVEVANERTGKPVKYASAHDLRRSCGDRLRNAGVPPLVICRVMRHASWETTRRHYAPGTFNRMPKC